MQAKVPRCGAGSGPVWLFGGYAHAHHRMAEATHEADQAAHRATRAEVAMGTDLHVCTGGIARSSWQVVERGLVVRGSVALRHGCRRSNSGADDGHNSKYKHW